MTDETQSPNPSANYTEIINGEEVTTVVQSNSTRPSTDASDMINNRKKEVQVKITVAQESQDEP